MAYSCFKKNPRILNIHPVIAGGIYAAYPQPFCTRNWFLNTKIPTFNQNICINAKKVVPLQCKGLRTEKIEKISYDSNYNTIYSGS